MEEKEEFIVNALYILKNMYNDEIEIIKNDNYEIILNNQSNMIKTKLDIKKYMRNIISNYNKNLENDIISLINLSYILDKKRLKTLKEIYSNFDLFVSTYIKLDNADIKLNISVFDYDNLLLYMVKTYIKYMKDIENENAYKIMSDKELELKDEIEQLENKLDKYQNIQKNKFYYETYINSLEYENNIYEQDKKALEINLENITDEISKKELELNKIENKKITLKKQEKINNYTKIINDLVDEKENIMLNLEKLEIDKKSLLINNNTSIKEYISNIEEYQKDYELVKDINPVNLLKEINNKKEELNKIIENLSNSNYPEIHLVLKYYCIDNLKGIDKKSDLNPKILNEIINVLENAIKPL